MNDRMVRSQNKRKYDVEKEHEKIVQQLNIDDYQLSRIPRPDDPQSGSTKKA